MSLFKKVFGQIFSGQEQNTSTTIVSDKDLKEVGRKSLRFGRYNDAFSKSNEQLNSWDKAVSDFKDKNYLDAYENFFKYLNDETFNTVSYERKENKISFQLIQGSKVVKGEIDDRKFKAEAGVVKFNAPSVPVMSKLLSINYSLRYSHFAINDNTYCIKGSSKSIDCSPSKLYYTLKEIATNADKQDDLLLSEFSGMESIEDDNIIDIPENEKEVKYKYLQQWIKETLEKTESLDENKFSGAISYLFLTLIYRIDFLITPEGKITDILERIQNIYFAKDNRSYIDKNREIADQFKKILELSKEDVFTSLYKTKCTFGIVGATDHKQIADFIYNQNESAKNYRADKGLEGITNEEIVLAIYEYVTGYSLFNFGMHWPAVQLFNLLMNVLHQNYYSEMGISTEYADLKTGSLNPPAIQEKIDQIIRVARQEYPNFNFEKKYLNYNSKVDFSETFLKEFDYFDFSK